MGISTSIFGAERLGPSDLDRIHDAGFSHVELFACRPHLDYRNRETRRELRDWFASHRMQPPSLHLPVFDDEPSGAPPPIWPLAPRAGQREAARDEIKRALELTGHIPIPRVVVHLGPARQRFDPTLFDHAWTLLEMIRSFSGTAVLVETLPGEVSSPARIRELLELTGIPETKICYDVGHEHLEGRAPTFEGAGEIHLDDNDGRRDGHLWPFEGGVDWPRLAAALALSGFDGPIVLEGPEADLRKATTAAGRFRALVDEARSSPGGFEVKHGLEPTK